LPLAFIVLWLACRIVALSHAGKPLRRKSEADDQGSIRANPRLALLSRHILRQLNGR
jgi:hypothetical protein